MPTPLGPVVASGAFADVYAIDEARVLRRYRSGRDASGEVQLLAHVVAHGFPAPGCSRRTAPTWSWSACTGRPCCRPSSPA
ncbi:hypothetical protein [Cellulomonas soli]